MIGNDIIDLKAAAVESNWKRPGYLDKLFSKHEQSLILNSTDQETTVWLLWAMKESSYKAHQRKFELPRLFNPKDYRCEITAQSLGSASGTVRIKENCYDISASIDTSRIHCIASTVPKKRILQKVFSVPTDVKKELISTISILKNLAGKKISLVKAENAVPHLMYQNRALNSNFSLSSHGKFSAFALMLRQY